MAQVELKKVGKRYGSTEVVHGADLVIEDNEFIVLVGPSGCGKSTILRMIAGLESVTDGEICIDGKPVNTVLPKDRNVAMVFQNYALYPHMSVYDNMAFSLRMAKESRQQIESKVQQAAEILELTAYLHRKPSELSGGQRQRVAMGRAIVRKPAVFLFDEPLSNLDAQLRTQMRMELKKLHLKMRTTTIYVTHDQVEAMTLADKIVVLKFGVIEQVGAPLDLYRDPDNKFVAGFIGSPAMNFVRGRVRNGAIEVPAFDETIHPDITMPAEGTDVIVGLRPEHALLDPSGETFTVELTEALGGISYAYLTSPTGETLIFEERGDNRSKVGDTVSLSYEKRRIYVFDAETEKRIR